MATKKAKPMVSKRVADRKAFVEKTAGMASTPRSKQAARQKFFVQTRMKELEAKGKPVDAAKRKELRQKFQSGNVSRAGFGAPKKKAASSTASSTSKVTPKSMPKSMPKAASKAGYSSAGKGKSASQDLNKRPVKALYKNK